MSKKILIAYKNTKVHDPNACHVGMGVTAKSNASFLSRRGIDTLAVSVNDGYDLRNKLRSDLADRDIVIMSAPFFDTGFLKRLCEEFANKTFIITFHSNAGFLGLDKWAMGMLGELIKAEKEIPNFRVSVNSEKFARVIDSIFHTKILVFLNLYFSNVTPSKPRFVRPTLKIGCFSAIRTLKNIPTAAFAAASLGKKLGAKVEFHIVVGRNEDKAAEKILEGIERLFSHIDGVDLIKNNWVEAEEFRTLVSKMNILIMPTFTESFNNVTADGISQGVPVVVGEAIDWLPRKFKANADDALDIAKAAEFLLFDPNSTIDGINALEKHNSRAFELWKENLIGKSPNIFKKIIGCVLKKIFRK